MKTNALQIDSMKGFAIAEVMVVLAVFSIGFLAAGQIQTRAVLSNTVARKSTEATAMATDRMEQLISLAYDHPDLLDRSRDGVAGLNDHTVETADRCDTSHPPYTVCWNIARIPTEPSPQTINYKRIRVIVAWMHRGLLRRHPLETLRTQQ